MKMARTHLSRDREQTIKMHYRAMHAINEALALCLHSTRTKDAWTCLRRDKHLELYAQRQPATTTCLLGVNETKCSFDEVRDLLAFDSTERFRLMMSLVHGADCKDAGLISMRPKHDPLLDTTVYTHHAAVWFALQNRRKPALVREKSFTFFQTLQIIVPEQLRPSGMTDTSRFSDAIQKRTLALSWLPFPEPDDSDALDTGSDSDASTADAVNLQYTLIVEELEPDRLRVSCVARSFHDGNAPHAASRWTARSVARRLVVRSIARLEGAVVASRISGHELLSPHKWVKNEERAACVICWKHFNAFYRRRHHCRVCGDVVCGSCSSLRRTNGAPTIKDVLKVRVCHLCSNKGRVKADSFASTTDTFPGHHTTDEEMPMAKLFPGPNAAPRVVRDSLIQPRRPFVGGTRRALDGDDDSDDDDDDDDEDDDDDRAIAMLDAVDSYNSALDGYIGRGPDSVVQLYGSQKVISIKSLQRSSDLHVRSMTTPATKPGAAALAKAHSTGDSKAVVMTKRALAIDQQPTRMSLSFLHPAAARPPSAHTLQPVVAEYGTYEDAPRLGSNSNSGTTARESLESESIRRTSIASSNAGLLDRYYVDDGYFLPKLDPLRELERLQLMKVVCSPACTLIEPLLMAKCCDVAASAFGVSSAFIARVDDGHVSIEHAVGARELRAYDQYLRHDTLCDFVLVQPRHQPIVILDCLVDPRTSGIPMVQQLGMRFFVGVPISVRGLPIGCLCAFSHASDESAMPTTTRYDLTILENAVRSIEAELEELVHGLHVA